MSKLMKVNIIQVITWTIVAIGVIIIFSLPNTISNWGDNKVKTILLALLFLVGFGIDFILRFYEKSHKWGFKRDERDKMIQYKTLSISFILVLIYIFLLSIGLYTVYEAKGMMPIGWVWLIAYSTIVAANLSTGICSLLIYRKQGY